MNSFLKVALVVSLLLGLMAILERPIDMEEFEVRGPAINKFFISFVTWSVAFGFNYLADRRFAFLKNRSLFHVSTFVTILVGSTFIIYTQNVLFKAPVGMSLVDPILINQTVYSGCWIAIITRCFKVAYNYVERTKKTAIANEKLVQEKTKSHLAFLNQQVNPHFLFNSLNTLVDLIERDNKPAISYVKEFSSVYRYVLDFGTKDLVTVAEELEFIRSYLFVLEKRFDDKLKTNFDISEKEMALKIPPLTLQNLVENAIKHNEVSSAHPLTIDITLREGVLSVRNPIRSKGKVPESGLGLQNLKSRVEYLLGTHMDYRQKGKDFMVTVPLLGIT